MSVVPFFHPPTPECPDQECTACGMRDCPHAEPLHYHHDGCPACDRPACYVCGAREGHHEDCRVTRRVPHGTLPGGSDERNAIPPYGNEVGPRRHTRPMQGAE